MADERKDDTGRSIGDEIRDEVRQNIRDGIRRAREARRRRRMMRRGGSPGVFIGLVLLCLGVIFLLDQQGIFPAREIFVFFWPGVLIFFGMLSLLSGRHTHSVFWGSLLIVVGAILLGDDLGYLHIPIATLWPLALIAFGIWLLLLATGTISSRPDPYRWEDWHDWHDPKYWKEDWNKWQNWEGKSAAWFKTPGVSGGVGTSSSGFGPASASTTPPPGAAAYVDDSDSEFSRSVIFSGFKMRVLSQHFKYGKAGVVLGGFHIDLTRADMDDTAIIHIEAVFGGGEIRIPENWKLVIEGGAIGGAFVDETFYHPTDPSAPVKRLMVRGSVVFGGVVIKN